MLSRNPISNISYHEPDELAALLRSLQDEGRIDGALWIQHKAEEDGKKPHIHLLLFPSGQIDTARHLACLSSSCSPIWQRTRSVTDWILYALHDAYYLERKGLSKKYSYSVHDLQATDETIVSQYLSDLPDMRPATFRHAEAYAKSGRSLEDLLTSGLVPLPYFKQACILYDIYQRQAPACGGLGAKRASAEGGKGGTTPSALAHGGGGFPPPNVPRGTKPKGESDNAAYHE